MKPPGCSSENTMKTPKVACIVGAWNGCKKERVSPSSAPFFHAYYFQAPATRAKPKGKLEICRMGVVQRKKFPLRDTGFNNKLSLGAKCLIGEEVGGKLPRIILI